MKIIVRPDDLRSVAMATLALVPIVSVVVLGASWLSRSSDQVSQIDREMQVMEVAATYEANRGTLSRSLHVLQAAALPGAGAALHERAEQAGGGLDLRESRAAEGEALMQAVGGTGAQSAGAQAASLRKNLETAISNHRAGDPVSPQLLASEIAIDHALSDGATPGLLLQVDILDQSANRLRSLAGLSVDFDRDLRRVLTNLAEGVLIDSSDLLTSGPLQPLVWDQNAQTWIPGLVQPAAASPGTIDSSVDDDPIATAFAGLEEASRVGDYPGRDRIIERLLTIDDQMFDALAGAEQAAMSAGQTERDDLETTRRLVVISLVVLLALGLALFVMTRQEMHRRRRVERAHTAALEEMQKKAYRDPLTGLNNRRWLDEVLPDRLRSLRTDQVATLVYVDLDGFKGINDVWGHDQGDLVLQEVGGFLASARQAQLGGWNFARFGGDEFVGFRVERAPGNHADTHDLVRALSEIDVNHQRVPNRVSISASAGVAVGGPGTSAPDLLLKADAALAHAKRRHRGSVHIHDSCSSAAELLPLLPLALSRGEMTVAVQPIYETTQGTLAGIEVLSRWHRGAGSVPPDIFVPLIETYGLCEDLTRNVVREVARLHDGDQELPRSWINISPVGLARTDFASGLLAILDAEGVHPTSLGIEVTESAAISDVHEVAKSLRILREHGIRVAIDDFGSGYTPLGYLRILPVDVIKIDRALVSEIEIDLVNQEIVSGIVRTAGRLGIDIVAEGVERAEEQVWLESVGVSLMQGYLLAEPIDAIDLAPESLRLVDLTRPDRVANPVLF